MGQSILKRTACCVVAALVVGLWLVPACAFANFRYPFLGQLTGFSGGGQYSSAASVAVDEKSGDTLVADWGSGEIKVFDASRKLVASWNGSVGSNPPGTPSGSFGGQLVSVAVNNATGEVYVVDEPDGVVDILSSTGAYIGHLTGALLVEPLSVAVDQATGEVYVGEQGHGAVDVFNAKGEYSSQLSGHAVAGPVGITVDDQTGKVLVAESSTKTVSVFDGTTGVYETTWNGSSATNPPGTPQGNFGDGILTVAADESNGHVYVSTSTFNVGVVDEFDGSGAYIGQITGTPSEPFGFLIGLMVAPGTGDIYVGDPGQNVVNIFGRGVLFPGVTTETVRGVSETDATLTGAVNPGGEPVTSCEFEYGMSTNYGHKASCSQAPAQIGSGTSPVAVSAEVSGLEPYTRYHYRLVAANAGGTEYGSDQWFVPTNEQFGFETVGPHAFSVTVSNSVVPNGRSVPEDLGGQLVPGLPFPYVANPNDLNTQAGAHPFAMTVNFHLKTTPFERMTGEQYAKDIAVEFPSGFAGSIVAVPQCPMQNLDNKNVGCPTASQVGTVVVWQAKGENSPESGFAAPVYNMVPSDRGTAEISFPVITVAQPVIVKVRTDGDYGIASMTTNISQEIAFDGLTITLWGDPADQRHDPERFLPLQGATNIGFAAAPRRPGNEKGAVNEWGEPLPDGTPQSPYLTNPTHCGAPIDASIVADSWRNPGQFDPVDGRPDLSDPKWVTASTPMYPAGVTGCNKLRFNPSITVTPDTAKANSPSGYAINLHVPQSTNPNDLATPALDNAVATLPQGLVINPGAADGLQACTSDSADPAGSPGNEIGLGSNAEPTCPTASQVGSVELKTPLLPEILYGQIYLSSEHSGSHYGVFVVIRGEGLLVKLHSSVFANPVTGQLTASFLNNPELPFSDFTMHFYGGPRAVFVNPATCGPATTTTDLTSWASEPGGLADATPSSTFDVSFDGIGAPCPSPQPFAPVFAAGTTSIQAGGFSPLTTTFSRPDEDQLVNHVQVTAPPGLLGTLREVPLCPEPQASEGTCSSASKIGHTIVAVGSGAAPLYLPVPGQPEQPVYVTGPYKGAPFGLTFVVPAVAGPYDLGRVIVRAAINVDPRTAQLTVTSDPLPTIIDGIPVQVKTVNVVIDRPNFVFNPTNCNPMNIGGSVTSLQGATAILSSSFQVTGCGDLKFQPRFSVSTSGHTSRAGGASLDARLSFPKNALGKDANIASVKVDLPKQLPSRLNTLQKACPARTFEANPTECSKGSIVGVAKAVTPTLPETLMGPVYFVSHGGEEFPNLIIVLQGDGVRVDLTGDTFIDEKTGITSSTFKLVPDVPVDSFELFLPQGPDSALAANGNLCKSALKMPASFTAQNGLSIHENIPISVTGCGAKAAKARKARTARKHKHRARKAGHGRAAAATSRRGH
jgi:DNA-binding beta-propeller fold protein YncE